MKMIKICPLAVLFIILAPTVPISASVGEKLRNLNGGDAFVRGLEATGLLDEVADWNTFTLFLPTEEAIGELPEGLWEELTEPENEAIFRSVLAHHILPRRFFADAMESGDVQSTEGETLAIYAGPFGFQAGGAPVVATDISIGESGVVHRIDGFLLPLP